MDIFWNYTFCYHCSEFLKIFFGHCAVVYIQILHFRLLVASFLLGHCSQFMEKKITFLQWFLSLKKAFIFARSKATKMITCLSKGSASYNAGCVMYKRNLNCSQALKLPGISEILYVW